MKEPVHVVSYSQKTNVFMNSQILCHFPDLLLQRASSHYKEDGICVFFYKLIKDFQKEGVVFLMFKPPHDDCRMASSDSKLLSDLAPDPGVKTEAARIDGISHDLYFSAPDSLFSPHINACVPSAGKKLRRDVFRAAQE